MGKRTEKSIDKACRKLWAKLVRHKYPRCVKCGKVNIRYGKEYTEAHHIFSVGCASTRFELDNGIGLCSRCHVFGPTGFQQNGSSPTNLKIIWKLIGKKRWEELGVQAEQIKKRTFDELLEVEKGFKKKLSKIEHRGY